jgi:acyl carrier protein
MALSELWCQLLSVETAETDENFFELGGDSLLAVEFSFAVEEQFEIALPLDVLFESANYGEVLHYLCDVIGGDEADGRAPESEL